MLSLMILFLLNTIVLGSIFIFFRHAYKKIQEQENILARQLIYEQDRYAQTKELNTSLSADLQDLDIIHTSTANLYEISKDLSSSLKLYDKAPMLNSKIWNILHCSSMRLILLSTQQTPPTIDQVLPLSGDNQRTPTLKETATEQDKAIAQHLFAHALPYLFIENTKSHPLLNILHLNAKTLSFLATPLKVNDKIIAIMTVENIDADYVDKALVIASQLSLDVHKSQLYETVEKLSIIDSLTQLYRRYHFMNCLQTELVRSEKNHFPLSCIMIDIDHFKTYNDTYGHLVGDEILKKLSQMIKNHIRDIDLVGRYGGEEFCLYLPETHKNNALRIAERLRKDVQQTSWSIGHHSLSITISLGVASFPEDARTLTELVDIADQNLYKAKESGRNRICF